MVKRYDMEKEYSLDINIVPVEEHDGAFVHYDDYAELLEALQRITKEAKNPRRDLYSLLTVIDNAQAAIAKALGE